jgi:hypothetical protein
MAPPRIFAELDRNKPGQQAPHWLAENWLKMAQEADGEHS